LIVRYWGKGSGEVGAGGRKAAGGKNWVEPEVGSGKAAGQLVNLSTC